MALVTFIKKLIETNTIWGTRSKKIAGIHDNANVHKADSCVFDNTAKTITIPLPFGITDLPKWITKIDSKGGSYFIVKTQGKTLKDPRNFDTNHRACFRVLEVDDNILTVEPTEFTSGTFNCVFDGRIAVITNDENISMLNQYGSTTFNVKNQGGTNKFEASQVSTVLTDHQHIGDRGQDILMHDRIANRDDLTLDPGEACDPSIPNAQLRKRGGGRRAEIDWTSFNAAGLTNIQDHLIPAEPSIITDENGEIVTKGGGL